MDLVTATRNFEKLFKEVRSPVKKGEDTSKIKHVCSGGTCAQDEPVPILYLDREKAIDEWLETASGMVGESTVLQWIDLPELVRFQITMADHKRGHRVVNDRFAVRAKFTVE